VRAQQGAAASTHTVKKGDTLWSLAKEYLGDAFLWPEIYRLNTGKIEDPHWIYPGEMLMLPSHVAAMTPSARSSAAPAARPEHASSASTTTAVTAAVTATAAPAARQQGPARRTTVFDPNRYKVGQQQRQSLNLRAGAGAVRRGEYRASPFPWSVGGPSDGGVLEEAVDAQGIGMTARNRPIQFLEAVFVHLPKGAAGNVGDQFLVYRLGRVIEDQGQAVVPTGVIKLIAPAANGRARAQLVKKFEDVFTGQGVTPLDTLKAPAGVMPVRVEFGLATRVTWINNDPVLPGSGDYLILAAGAKEGLAPGDQVALLHNRGADLKGAALPDEQVAVAEVTRVTPWGAGAIILMTYQPGVAEGMRARVTAKMP
jgi:hypothetical protein